MYAFTKASGYTIPALNNVSAAGGGNKDIAFFAGFLHGCNFITWKERKSYSSTQPPALIKQVGYNITSRKVQMEVCANTWPMYGWCKVEGILILIPTQHKDTYPSPASNLQIYTLVSCVHRYSIWHSTQDSEGEVCTGKCTHNTCRF